MSGVFHISTLQKHMLQVYTYLYIICTWTNSSFGMWMFRCSSGTVNASAIAMKALSCLRLDPKPGCAVMCKKRFFCLRLKTSGRCTRNRYSADAHIFTARRCYVFAVVYVCICIHIYIYVYIDRYVSVYMCASVKQYQLRVSEDSHPRLPDDALRRRPAWRRNRASEP